MDGGPDDRRGLLGSSLRGRLVQTRDVDVVQVYGSAIQLCRAKVPARIPSGVTDDASRVLPGSPLPAPLLVEELLGVMQADSESGRWNRRRRRWAASAGCQRHDKQQQRDDNWNPAHRTMVATRRAWATSPRPS